VLLPSLLLVVVVVVVVVVVSWVRNHCDASAFAANMWHRVCFHSFQCDTLLLLRSTTSKQCDMQVENHSMLPPPPPVVVVVVVVVVVKERSRKLE